MEANASELPAGLRRDLFDLVRCPACGGRLAPGQLVRCVSCGALYGVEEGILDLNPRPTEEAAQEMEAHRVMEERWMAEVGGGPLGELVTGDTGFQVMLSLPHCPYPELIAALPDMRRIHELGPDFFALIGRLRLRGEETVLELGSHLGWSAWRLAQAAGVVVATDISHQLAVAQPYVNVGPYFHRVKCDMHVLPFGAEQFDLVFGVAVIHHSGDLAGLFQRVAAVLRPGGRAVFFAEPVVGVGDSAAREAFGAEEKALGVQEHVYTIDEYLAAARGAGLRPRVEPLPGILLEAGRKWWLARRLWLWLLRCGVGYGRWFTAGVYPWMLRRYPRIPFPRFALVLEKGGPEGEERGR